MIGRLARQRFLVLVLCLWSWYQRRPGGHSIAYQSSEHGCATTGDLTWSLKSSGFL